MAVAIRSRLTLPSYQLHGALTVTVECRHVSRPSTYTSCGSNYWRIACTAMHFSSEPTAWTATPATPTVGWDQSRPLRNRVGRVPPPSPPVVAPMGIYIGGPLGMRGVADLIETRRLEWCHSYVIIWQCCAHNDSIFCGFHRVTPC